MARQANEYYYFTEGASPVSPFIVRSGENKYYYYYDDEGTSSVSPSIVQRGENWDREISYEKRPLRCPYCGKNHMGMCRRMTGECYRCGRLGHFVRDCPESSRARQAISSRARQAIPGPTSTIRKPRKPLCFNCGKHHWGECRRYTGACFRCGDRGHKARDCPRR